MIVVDANVLLYAHHRGSHLHRESKSWLEAALSGTETIGFAWSVVSAFLRIATNPRAFSRPLTLADAVKIVDSWFTSAAAISLSPGPGHWRIFRDLVVSGKAAGNLVMDAHLAALTIEHGGVLLSSDRDFARFPDLKFQPFGA